MIYMRENMMILSEVLLVCIGWDELSMIVRVCLSILWWGYGWGEMVGLRG